MSYNKIIKYGNKMEVYEYELSPSFDLRAPRKKRVQQNEFVKFNKREDNVKQAKINFRRLVEANFQSENPILLTLTHKENMDDISIGYKNLRMFIQALRYRYGKIFKYIAVPEFQSRGAIHFHTLFWNLPSHITPEQERKDRILQKIWGHGFIDLVETDGHEKLSGYLAKYLGKTFVDMRLKNQKAYVASRNIKRPEVIKNAMLFPEFYLHLDEDDKAIFDHTYKTRHLGKCRHRLFKMRH